MLWQKRNLNLRVFLQRVKDLVVDHLIGIVAVIGKNIDTASFKMLDDRGGAGGRATLPVIALAENVEPVAASGMNKFGKRVGFGQITFIGQAIIG